MVIDRAVTYESKHFAIEYDMVQSVRKRTLTHRILCIMQAKSRDSAIFFFAIVVFKNFESDIFSYEPNGCKRQKH